MTPLTKTQIAALRFIASRPNMETSAYGLSAEGVGNMATMRALFRRRMVKPVGLGHVAFPNSGIYRITVQGMKAIA